MFSIVFYSKTVGKQRMLSEWVNPKTSGPENWYIAFSDIVDSNCKRFLETYFVFLNPITRPPTEVVHLTDFVQDKKSAIRQHCKKCRHGGKSSDFKIIGTGYRSTVHRKLAEALYIRDLKPTLNKQRDAFKLHLFN